LSAQERRYHQNLETRCQGLNLKDHVIFTGFQNDPVDYLSLMDIFLLPSFTEGTSMTLLEAMSLGIPTVATRVGGTPEIIVEGKTGFLCESDDVEAFTRAIEQLLNEPETHRAMSQAALADFSHRFPVEQMVNQYRAAYIGDSSSSH